MASPSKGKDSQGLGHRDLGEKKPRYEPIVFRGWCKSCGICSAFCPRNVIRKDPTGAPVIAAPERCTGCRFCELHCPDFAITVERMDEEGRVEAV